MKKLTLKATRLILGILLTTVMPQVVFAQTENDEVTLYQTLYGMEKRDLIQEAVQVPEAQSTIFWNIYEEFEKERREIGKERVALIKKYAANLQSTDPVQLDEIAKSVLANESRYIKLESTYYDKMKKAIDVPTAFRWMQIERYLELTIKQGISEQLPFLPKPKQ